MEPLEYLKQNEAASLDQFKELLRIPSISAQSRHKDDIRRCAQWVSDYLKKLGIESELCEPGGHPLVYGNYHVSDDVPTVLVYGHYDVQPVDPLNLWKSQPFEPIEENGYIIARGATDDKGQMFAHLKGVESYLKTVGKIPVNVKFMIEGEEETAAENLTKYIADNKDKFAADIVIVSDGSMYGRDLPAINYGLRGIAAVEVKLTGPNRDLHSGSYGGAVGNPVNMLCQMIGKLHDADGRVTIDGFYDNVYTMTDWERKQFANLPFDEKEYLASTGAPALWGEKGFSVMERTTSRPTLDCNGITGGYQGEGGKTIIPSWASAKITMRLVPNQTPDEICAKFEAHLRKLCPPSATLEVSKYGGANPVLVPTEGPWLEAAARAIKTGFKILGIDTVLIGFGQHDDNAHSPNERFLVKDFHRGCRTSAALFDELSKVKA